MAGNSNNLAIMEVNEIGKSLSYTASLTISLESSIQVKLSSKRPVGGRNGWLCFQLLSFHLQSSIAAV